MTREAADKHVAMQLLRSATSAGANYEEARGAQSKQDFVHKVTLSTKEMRETIYWLRVLEGAQLIISTSIQPCLREAFELAAILGASMRTARKGL